MKRLLVILVSAIALSIGSVCIGAAVSASPSPARGHVGTLNHGGQHMISHGVIAAGETWTLYDLDTFDNVFTCNSLSEGISSKCTGSSDDGVAICEELTFGAHAKTFTGDIGDSGTVKKNVMLTFSTAASGLWYAYNWYAGDNPLVFIGKYYSNASGFTHAGFYGPITADGVTVGAATLIDGPDPLATGDC